MYVSVLECAKDTILFLIDHPQNRECALLQILLTQFPSCPGRRAHGLVWAAWGAAGVFAGPTLWLFGATEVEGGLSSRETGMRSGAKTRKA